MMLLQMLILVLVAWGGLRVVCTRDPLAQAMVVSYYGIVLALMFVIFQAPDVALAQSDTPGKAGGLMSGTASKAVGSGEGSKIALVRQPLPDPECRDGLAPAQNPPSTRHTRVPRSGRRQRCGLVPQIVGQWQWHFCL